MEAAAMLIRTIVILTLSTGPVFVDLDEPVSPAGALQIAQGVTKQDFETIGAKVYYCPGPPLPEGLRGRKVQVLSIAEVSEDWRPPSAPPKRAVRDVVMVITTSDFETLGEVAEAIEEAKPKAKHIKVSGKLITHPLSRFGLEFIPEELTFLLPGAEVYREEPELLPQEAARFQIAEILVEEGKYAEAVNELELILASTASEEVKNLARARISTIYAKMGLDEKSEGELKKIIESTTNLELKKRALMTLASLLRTQKRYDEAVAALRQVIELTQPDVMKLLQFRKEFMPGGFTLAPMPPHWHITGNPGWLTKFGQALLAKDWGFNPKRGYVCFFDKKGQATDDLYYLLLEFDTEDAASFAAGGMSEEMWEEQSDRFFGAAFAASNVVILIWAERAEYIPAAKWLGITLLNALPARLQPKPPKPRPLPVGISANETAAIGALRSLMAGQEEFRMADIIDQDTDGAGEYGYYQELCATIAPPGHAVPVSPGFFDPVFGVINASGVASKGGYYFRIFLPGPDGGPAVAEVAGANSATASPGAVNSRENRWTAYAWPMEYARTGSRAFVVNQAGNVFATAAMVLTYDATATMPAANAAYLVGTKNLSGALADGVADDGNTWHWVR